MQTFKEKAFQIFQKGSCITLMLQRHQDFKDYLEPIIFYSNIPKAFFTSSSPNISIACFANEGDSKYTNVLWKQLEQVTVST